jgi:cation:H+ antiporter
VVALCGLAVAHAGLSLVEESGLSGSLVGGLFTSVVTSLPELVTVLAAVRRGALQLAVGDIVGGNAFDVLFIAAADVAYRRAPIYTGLGHGTLFVLALTLLLTALLAAGLLYRQRRGIGFEGLAILVVYAVGFILLSGIDGD